MQHEAEAAVGTGLALDGHEAGAVVAHLDADDAARRRRGGRPRSPPVPPGVADRVRHELGDERPAGRCGGGRGAAGRAGRARPSRARARRRRARRSARCGRGRPPRAATSRRTDSPRASSPPRPRSPRQLAVRRLSRAPAREPRYSSTSTVVSSRCGPRWNASSSRVQRPPARSSHAALRAARAPRAAAARRSGRSRRPRRARRRCRARARRPARSSTGRLRPRARRRTRPRSCPASPDRRRPRARARAAAAGGRRWPASARAVPSPRSSSRAQTIVHSGRPGWPRSVSLSCPTARADVARELGGGARGEARERGPRGRLGPLAGDVADHDHPRVRALEDVVEVAADLVELAGRAVQDGGRPARDLGQLAAAAGRAGAPARSRCGGCRSAR